MTFPPPSLLITFVTISIPAIRPVSADLKMSKFKVLNCVLSDQHDTESHVCLNEEKVTKRTVSHRWDVSVPSHQWREDSGV